MDKKSVLTSIIALGFVTPAIADFPADGLMKANQVYTGAAIHENMGVYEGTVYANAVYEEAVYELLAGTYLPQSSTSGATCDSGYYCPGGSYRYSTSGNQGIYQCSGEFNNSDSGATSVNDCYKACNVADFPHAATVTGNDYYRGYDATEMNDTCTVTSCDVGWSVTDINLNNTIVNYTGVGTGAAYLDTWSDFYLIHTDSEIETPSHYGLKKGQESGLWSVVYGINGILVGKARLSNVAGSYDFHQMPNSTNPGIKRLSELGANEGEHCWCSLVRFQDGGSLGSASWLYLDSPWVYYGELTANLNDCANACAEVMFGNTADDLYFRHALAENVKAASCQPSVITINWSDTTTEEINANQARTAIYGGDIRTPRSANPVEGKIFKGWEFVSDTQGGIIHNGK